MTRWVLLLAVLVGCSPLHRIPVPKVPISTRQIPPPQAHAHYVRGRLALLEGDLVAAHGAFSMARVFDPQSPYIPIALGEVALVGGDKTAAGLAWEEATRVDPTCALAWMFRARIERLKGRATIAAGHYAQARKLGHGWQAWAGEIDAWLHAQQRDKAEAVMVQWGELQIVTPGESSERGQRRLVLGDPEGAAADLFPAAQSRPEDLSAVRQWVTAVLLWEDGAPAMAQVDVLRARAPRATAPLWAAAVLAHALGDQGRVKAALECWADLSPDDEALRTLKQALAGGGPP